MRTSRLVGSHLFEKLGTKKTDPCRLNQTIGKRAYEENAQARKFLIGELVRACSHARTTRAEPDLPLARARLAHDSQNAGAASPGLLGDSGCSLQVLEFENGQMGIMGAKISPSCLGWK